ncbi:MAG TPA: hypothetical protein DEG96_06270 [Candidatus Atribacteria bacterium]|nr:hypothetical protein [Candidatus Atribacteria bacterium]
MLKSPKNHIRISRNFILSEFECPCCKRVMIDFRLVDMLEILRKKIGDKPIIVNSGYRCVEYNQKVGGVPESYHLYGMAADVRVPGVAPAELLAYAEEVGFLGLGLYDTFCHLDIRYNYTRWEG